MIQWPCQRDSITRFEKREQGGGGGGGGGSAAVMYVNRCEFEVGLGKDRGGGGGGLLPLEITCDTQGVEGPS